jgi:hypothetical protein
LTSAFWNHLPAAAVELFAPLLLADALLCLPWYASWVGFEAKFGVKQSQVWALGRDGLPALWQGYSIANARENGCGGKANLK